MPEELTTQERKEQRLDFIRQLGALVELEAPQFLVDEHLRLLCRMLHYNPAGNSPAAPPVVSVANAEPGNN